MRENGKTSYSSEVGKNETGLFRTYHNFSNLGGAAGPKRRWPDSAQTR